MTHFIASGRFLLVHVPPQMSSFILVFKEFRPWFLQCLAYILRAGILIEFLNPEERILLEEFSTKVIDGAREVAWTVCSEGLPLAFLSLVWKADRGSGIVLRGTIIPTPALWQFDFVVFSKVC